MKGIIVFIGLFSLVLAGCNGQSNDKTIQKSTESMPKTSVHVNKEYDANGNLIRYDSAYSYFYSNIKNDTVFGDSLMDQFRILFGENYPWSNDPFLNDFFLQDSLLDNNFYTPDFYLNRYLNNTRQMEDMFRRMDSVKNQFFMDQFYDIPDKKK